MSEQGNFPKPSVSSEVELQGLFISGDLIRSLTRHQVESLGEAALNFGIRVEPIYESYPAISGTGEPDGFAALNIADASPASILALHREIAIEAEDSDAMADLAGGLLDSLAYLPQDNPEKALETFTLFARSDDASARRTIAVCVGDLTKADANKAFELWVELLGDTDEQTRGYAKDTIDEAYARGLIDSVQALGLIRACRRTREF
jgi:hypothetical protein